MWIFTHANIKISQDLSSVSTNGKIIKILSPKTINQDKEHQLQSN